MSVVPSSVDSWEFVVWPEIEPRAQSDGQTSRLQARLALAEAIGLQADVLGAAQRVAARSAAARKAGDSRLVRCWWMRCDRQ